MEGGGILPCCSPRCCPPWHSHSAKDLGKVPLCEQGVNGASVDPEQTKEWAEKWPNANVGLRGLVLVDIDDHPDKGRDGITSITQLCEEYTGTDVLTAFAGLVHVLTGGGGLQFWALPSDVADSKDKIAPGIEIRGRGSYCIIPPSTHASGLSYEFFDDVRTPTAPLPEWFLELAMRARPRKRNRSKAREEHSSPKTASPASTLTKAPPDNEAPAGPDHVVVMNPELYLETAWARSHARIHTAVSFRNRAIYDNVLDLAKLIPHGYFDEEDVVAMALSAATVHIESEKDPLDEAAVTKTIESALANGRLHPKILVDSDGLVITPTRVPSTGSRNVENVALTSTFVGEGRRKEENASPTPLTPELPAQQAFPRAGALRDALPKLTTASCKSHDRNVSMVGPKGTRIYHIRCSRKACPTGRARWAREKVKPFEEDFDALPVYRLRLADDAAWVRYQARVRRMRQKGVAISLCPVPVGNGRRVVLTTHAPSPSAVPVENPLLELHELLMISEGQIRPSDAWQTTKVPNQGFTLLERAYRQDVLLVLEALGHISPPSGANFHSRHFWRIELYLSNKSVSVPGFEGVQELVERIQKRREERRNALTTDDARC